MFNKGKAVKAPMPDAEVSPKGKKKKSKFKYLVIGVAGVVIVGAVAIGIKGGNTTNFLDVTNTLLTQTTGKYRYVLDVRTSQSKGATSSTKEETQEELEELEASTDVDEIVKKYQDKKKDFVNWEGKNGVEDSDWKFPKYKIVFEGNVKSVEPLEMNMDISLVTNSFNDKLTQIVVKKDKTYIDMEQLRYWLMNSKSSVLVKLGQTVPDGTKWVKYKGDAFNLRSTFAEDSEADASRESNLIKLYGRLVNVIQVAERGISIDKSCFSSESNTYKLNLAGNNATKALEGVKYVVDNIGEVHHSAIKQDLSNKLLTKEQYAQADNETDNIVSAFKGVSSYLASADLDGMGLQATGTARVYKDDSNAKVYESKLSTQFTANNVDYNVAVELYKALKVDKIEEPTQSVINASDNVTLGNDKDFIYDYFVVILDYLNISGVDVTKHLALTVDNVKTDAYKSFVKIINDKNKSDSNFSPITVQTLPDYIKKYRTLEVTQSTSKQDKANKELVLEFLDKFKDIIPSETSEQDTDAVLKDADRFPLILFENKQYKVFVNFDSKNSDAKLLKYDCTFINKTNKPITFKTHDFCLKNTRNSKYPANDLSLITEHDNGFKKSNLVENINLPSKGYATGSLYFVLPALEPMDLYNGSIKFGKVIRG